MKKNKKNIYLLSGALFMTAYAVYADTSNPVSEPYGNFSQQIANPESELYHLFSTDFNNIINNLGNLGQQNGQVLTELKDIDNTLQKDLGDIGESIKKLLLYVKNLGLYFGYDITKYCTPDGKCAEPNSAPAVSSQMINLKESFQNQFNLISTSLGAMLPTSAQNSGLQQTSFAIVPPNNETIKNYEWIFKFANQSFKNFNQVNPNKISVSNLIDQQPYQNDPVSQSLLNIIATPNDSFCYDKSKGILQSQCVIAGSGGGSVITQGQVAMNVIGGFPMKDSYPAISNFSSPIDNVSLINQLSSDSLLGPLMFDNSGQGNTNQQAQKTAGGRGLIAQNQAQNAANFIRYATGAVNPLQLPNQEEYGALYIRAANLSGKVPQAEQTQAQIQIANYLTSLRVYAAQTSVGISNLYYILSKRMPLSTNPQKEGSDNSGEQTSQALSEYMMATRRLQIPAGGNNNNQQQPWFNQINNSSPATVQKEIAMLLAEINYQLYLTRMQQERLLLTNTMLLMQISGARQPNPRLGEQTPQSENSLFTNQSGQIFQQR